MTALHRFQRLRSQHDLAWDAYEATAEEIRRSATAFTVEAASPDGSITMTVDCRFRVRSLNIEADVWDDATEDDIADAMIDVHKGAMDEIRLARRRFALRALGVPEEGETYR